MASPILTPSKGAPTSSDEYFRRQELMIDANLQAPTNYIEGMYVAFSPNNISVWHASLFVHAGPYAGGVFRFRLIFPPTYPNTPPTVMFQSEIYHPLISYRGEYYLKAGFPRWVARKDYAIDALRYIKASFSVEGLERISGIRDEGLGNLEALSAFREGREQFDKLARQSADVSKSPSMLYYHPPLDPFDQDPLEADNPMRFHELTNGEFSDVRDMVLAMIRKRAPYMKGSLQKNGVTPKMTQVMKERHEALRRSVGLDDGLFAEEFAHLNLRAGADALGSPRPKVKATVSSESAVSAASLLSDHPLASSAQRDSKRPATPSRMSSPRRFGTRLRSSADTAEDDPLEVSPRRPGTREVDQVPSTNHDSAL
ncbi:Ubiquitin-conjugating enzyme subunit [Saitoella coloradoensis]